MKTIKIIDLLVKIANNEKLPETIKYHGGIYHKYNQCGYFYAKAWDEETLLDNIQCTSDLTAEVEIIELIEEDKEIEEALGIILLGQCDNWLQKRDVNIKSDFELNPYILEAITENFKSLYHKQCDLVKAVNELKKGK